MREAPTVEPAHLRACLSRFVTGVTVVSYTVDGDVRGLTVSSFSSVSLDPPLVLVCVARSARATRHLGGIPFTVSVLSASQLDVALHFAGRQQHGVRPRWKPADDGLAPSLAGALAAFHCRPWQTNPAGDHWLHVGQVARAEMQDEGEPLLFDRGQLCQLGTSGGDVVTAARAA